MKKPRGRQAGMGWRVGKAKSAARSQCHSSSSVLESSLYIRHCVKHPLCDIILLAATIRKQELCSYSFGETENQHREADQSLWQHWDSNTEGSSVFPQRLTCERIGGWLVRGRSSWGILDYCLRVPWQRWWGPRPYLLLPGYEGNSLDPPCHVSSSQAQINRARQSWTLTSKRPRQDNPFLFL